MASFSSSLSSVWRAWSSSVKALQNSSGLQSFWTKPPISFLGSYRLQQFVPWTLRTHSSKVLFGLKLAVQFHTGSTVLIQSGCMDHGNTPIHDGEVRLSITQHTAGGLFRWVAYGFWSAKSLLKTAAGRQLKKKIDKDAGERWREGLAMFSTIGGLQADADEAFFGVD